MCRVVAFLNAQGTVLSRFECPSSTSLFIAAVARQLPHTTSESKLFSNHQALSVPSQFHLKHPEFLLTFLQRVLFLLMVRLPDRPPYSKSKNGIAAKVRGLSTFAMTAPSFPEEVNEPMAPQIPSQETPSLEVLAQKIPTQEISRQHISQQL